MRKIGFEILGIEPLTHFAAGSVAFGKSKRRIQPVAARSALLRGKYFDLLSVAQRRIERDDRTVYLCAATAVPELAVDVIREIDRCCTSREVDDPPLRRQHVKRVGKE